VKEVYEIQRNCIADLKCKNVSFCNSSFEVTGQEKERLRKDQREI